MGEMPTWGLSIVLNYRQFFKEKYGRDTKLSDPQIWDIYGTVFDDSSTQAQDLARVEAMKAAEN